MLMNSLIRHQYIDRATREVKTEHLFFDRLINFLYSHLAEQSNFLFSTLTSPRATDILGYLNFDFPLKRYFYCPFRLAKTLSVDLDECLDPPEALDTPRKFFERKIKYRRYRPKPPEKDAVVSPADSKMLVGTFEEHSLLFVKEKFFSFQEMLGESSTGWLTAFHQGSFAVFRLTPDKYHYNHAPVSGRVVDIYQIPGRYHSCNPGAVVHVLRPYSKNKRVVTIIDTDVEDGTGIGLVAMIEVVALMIGDVVQCYSDQNYDCPRQIEPGMMLAKGQPKSLFRPGSSVVVLIFQPGRVAFCSDIVSNLRHSNAVSRFSQGFGKSLVETEVNVRSKIGKRRVR
jgi:phosphatidylserine decarboxylase